MQYLHVKMAKISFVVVKTLYQTKAYYDFRDCKNQTTKSSQKKLLNMTINLPSYIIRGYSDTPGFLFH